MKHIGSKMFAAMLGLLICAQIANAADSDVRITLQWGVRPLVYRSTGNSPGNGTKLLLEQPDGSYAEPSDEDFNANYVLHLIYTGDGAYSATTGYNRMRIIDSASGAYFPESSNETHTGTFAAFNSSTQIPITTFGEYSESSFTEDMLWDNLLALDEVDFDMVYLEEGEPVSEYNENGLNFDYIYELFAENGVKGIGKNADELMRLVYSSNKERFFEALWASSCADIVVEEKSTGNFYLLSETPGGAERPLAGNFAVKWQINMAGMGITMEPSIRYPNKNIMQYFAIVPSQAVYIGAQISPIAVSAMRSDTTVEELMATLDEDIVNEAFAVGGNAEEHEGLSLSITECVVNNSGKLEIQFAFKELLSGGRERVISEIFNGATLWLDYKSDLSEPWSATSIPVDPAAQKVELDISDSNTGFYQMRFSMP